MSDSLTPVGEQARELKRTRGFAWRRRQVLQLTHLLVDASLSCLDVEFDLLELLGVRSLTLHEIANRTRGRRQLLRLRAPAAPIQLRSIPSTHVCPQNLNILIIKGCRKRCKSATSCRRGRRWMSYSRLILASSFLSGLASSAGVCS